MKESLHYLLMADHFMFQKALLNAIKTTGLTPGQPKIIDYLSKHDGAVQKEIAASCHIEPASLTTVLNGMENKGLVERKMPDGNRRSLCVFLTEKGWEYAEQLEQEFDIIEKAALTNFSTTDKKQLNELLSKVYENMIAYHAGR